MQGSVFDRESHSLEVRVESCVPAPGGLFQSVQTCKTGVNIPKSKEGNAGSVCCVMQSVRVLVMCCGIVLLMLVPSRWS